MDEILVLAILMALLHFLRLYLTSAMLIMNSVFLGKMNSHNLPVDENIVIAEAFAAVGVVASVLGIGKAVLSGFDLPIRGRRLRFLAFIIMESFIMGCCIFIAVIYKAGAGGCDSYADTPFGDIKGQDGLPGVRSSCGMQAATFAVSIVATLTSSAIIVAGILLAWRP